MTINNSPDRPLKWKLLRCLLVLVTPPDWAGVLFAELIKRRRLIVSNPMEWLINAANWAVSVVVTAAVVYCLIGWLLFGSVVWWVAVIDLVVYAAVGAIELFSDEEA